MSTERMSTMRILTMAGLVLLGLALLAVVWMRGALIPLGLAYAAVPLVMAGLVATRVSWAPAVATVVAALYLLESLQGVPAGSGMTSEPTGILPFMWLDAARVLQTVASAIATVAGIGTLLQHGKPSGEGV